MYVPLKSRHTSLVRISLRSESQYNVHKRVYVSENLDKGCMCLKNLDKGCMFSIVNLEQMIGLWLVSKLADKEERFHKWYVISS